MPELPEVTVIAENLKQKILNKKITGVHFQSSRIFFNPRPAIKKALLNQRITALTRRGKFLLFRLSGGLIMLAHLGMSGQMLLKLEKPDRHTALKLEFADGTRLFFRDPRRFGKLGIIKNSSDYPALAAMGPEPLDQKTTPQILRENLQKSAGPIKNLLLDQRKIAGLGNIYASEALYSAKINPRRAGKSLKTGDFERLLTAIQEILKKAIAQGGTTFDGVYVDAEGKPGGFLSHCRVYERQGEPCCRCGAPISCERIGGRSSYFCPVCQK